MLITLYSYSIKYRDECPAKNPNFVFDCRGVKNPGRISELKMQTGLDLDVIQYLEEQPSAQAFKQGLEMIVMGSLPVFISQDYTKEMAFGFCCTGGRHRSVYFCETIAKALSKFENIDVVVNHLDIASNYTQNV